MSNYTKTTDFEAKDSLPSGDSGKIIRGSEFETEFDNISTAIATKADAASPTFTGTVTIDGLTVNGNTTLGNAATDTVTVTADIASNLLPSADDTYNLGAVGAEWNDLFIDGTANIDSLVAGSGSFTSGIDVTGTVTADGLTVAGSDSTIKYDVASSNPHANPTFELKNQNATDGNVAVLKLSADNANGVSGSAYVYAQSETANQKGNLIFAREDGANTPVASMKLSSNGDISFYEDTGTTPKFFWDASAERLGIGNSSPTTVLDVTGTVTADALTIDGTATFNAGSSTTDNVVITSTDSGGSTAPDLVLFRDSASPADGDNVGMVQFRGNDDASAERNYAAIYASINDATSTSVDGKLSFAVTTANTTAPSSGTTFMTIDGGGDISFYEDTGTTAKFFWDASAERLGLGTSSPSAPLTLSSSGTSSAFATFNSGNSADITSYSARAGLELISYQSDNGSPYTKTSALIANADGTVPSEMQFWTKANGQSSPAERMRIDSQGRLGLGTSSPNRVLHVEGTPTTFGDTQSVLQIADDTAMAAGVGGGLVFTGKATTGQSDSNTAFAGIHAEKENGTSANTSGTMIFSTRSSGSNPAERMRLDSSGHLLVGKSTSDVGATTGFEWYDSSNVLLLTRHSGHGLSVNRLSSDGDLVTFRKDGTTVGSIGTKSSDLTVGTGDTGLRFTDSTNQIWAVDSTNGSSRDAAVDLGNPSVRFKDLYLSGGAYLGGTVAANKLDDYEEGTWTPAPTSGTLNSGATGSYVKIGSLVHVQGQLSFSANGTTNRINGLPFRPRIEGALNSIRQRFLVYSNNNTAIYAYCQDTNEALFLQNEDRSAHDFATADGVYTFAFTYEV